MKEITKAEYIKISDNLKLIRELITDLIVKPRNSAIKWSKITNQTPNLKIGYPGQHLASLITGVKGTGTGARGDDLEDGTEVKSCSRIDQLDTCIKCKSRVLRTQEICPNCGSSDIKRKNDSKWLFTIREQRDIDLLLNEVPRILLLLGDYPNFDANDFSKLRFQSFEIWPKHKRHKNFCKIIKNYYNNIYLENKKKNSEIVPAPKNFWPYQFQFYMSNPIKTCEIIIDKEGNITIPFYTAPYIDRATLSSVIMPTDLLNKEEENKLKTAGFDLSKGITEDMRGFLSLRKDSTATQKTRYRRHSSNNP